MTRALSLLPPRQSQVVPAPAELGEIVDAKQVRTRFFQERVSIEWVLDHVAPEQKWYMGRLAVWYEGHVKAWYPMYVRDQQARAQLRRERRAK